jgi:hypothetical protein
MSIIREYFRCVSSPTFLCEHTQISPEIEERITQVLQSRETKEGERLLCHALWRNDRELVQRLDPLLSRLSLRPVGAIDQAPQKVGNCSWTSLESSFLALLYIVLEKRIPDSAERLALCREIYKCFTTFARKRSAIEYRLSEKHPNPEFLGKLQQKLLKSRRFTELEKEEMLPTERRQSSMWCLIS